MAELKDISAEALRQTMEWVKQAKDFAVEQAPLLAREVVRYGIVANGAAVIAGVLLLIFGVLAWRTTGKNWEKWAPKEKWDDPTPKQVFGLTFTVVGICSGIPMIMACGFPLLKAIYAPRVYLLDKLTALLK